MSWKPADAFKEISRGNREAEAFMETLYIWFHKQDDLIDRDRQIPAETAAGWDLRVLHTVAKNTFFQQNQEYLWPVLTMSALAWIASEAKKDSEDVIERITAQVLKSQYLDVFLAVAFCLGGFEHAAAMSRKFREYSFDAEPVKKLDNGVDLRETDGKGA
jgi:hypothetical protein